MTEIIAITNRKGGTGKTTTAVNLATCLAETGKKIVLLDGDPQGNATSSVGHKHATHDTGTVLLFTQDATLEDAAEDTDFENLRVVTAGSLLTNVELEHTEKTKWQYTLRNKIEKAQADYIIIDTSPSFGVLAINSLVAATQVIVPLQCDYFSLEGLSDFAIGLNNIREKFNSQLKLTGLLKTMYDNRTLLSRQVSEELDRHFGSKVFSTVIPRNVRLAEAPSHGVPIIFHDSNSTGAKAYRAFAQEFLELQ